MTRLQAVDELFEVGVAMMRQNLKRTHPEDSEEQIDQRLRDWLLTRPGAPHGDSAGSRGVWPRR